MTPIFLYSCLDAPENRRWIAQFSKLAENMYITMYGSTPEIARQKAVLMQQFAALPPNERKDFNLKARLLALGGPEVEISEDELL